MKDRHTDTACEGKEGRRPLGVLPFLCILLSVCAALAPFFLTSLGNVRRYSVIRSYEAEGGALPASEIQKMRDMAVSYNEGIAEEQVFRMFTYRGAGATDPAYEEALSGAGPVMAYVEVPSCGISVPVYHGTREEDLAFAAGHMYGTSLPVGGGDTHAVIAAHSGLTARKIFDDLDRAAVGDVFYIHVLGEIHTYRVTEVNVVPPEVEAAYLQVENGRDLVSLYTCTPPGINSKRLIVTGEREGDLGKEGLLGEAATVRTLDRRALLRVILSAMVPVSLAAWFIIYRLRRRRDREAH